MQNVGIPISMLVCLTILFGTFAWLDPAPAHAQSEPDLVQLTHETREAVSSYPAGFTELNGAVYFGINSELGGLWRTDGTSDGTVLVKGVQTLPESFFKVGDLLYFVGSLTWSGDPALWRSDGTTAGTVQLVSMRRINPYSFAALGNTLYFVASEDREGAALWKTDGTPAGTQVVFDLMTDEDDIESFKLLAGPETLYIAHTRGTEPHTLWRSDGTTAGTRAIAGAPQSPEPLAVVGNVLYFNGFDEVHGRELWRYTPATDSPELLVDLFPGPGSSFVSELTVIDQQFFFGAEDEAHGSELWRSDGTAAGTHLVKDIAPGAAGSSVQNLTLFNNQLYFVADNGTWGLELWRSDGTEAGTTLVRDIVPGSVGSYPGELTVMGSHLYFNLGTYGSNARRQGLWKSDGTEAGTTPIKREPIGYGNLTAAGSALYFNAFGPLYGYELWTSDGTTEGTRFVKDVDPDHYAERIESVMPVGDRVYFTRPDYDVYPLGAELWMSDGTGADAIPIDEIPLRSKQAAGDNMFIGSEDETGPGLWKHDGTTLELIQRFAVQSPRQLLARGNEIFFIASDRMIADEAVYDLWRSDGTAAGTFVLVEGESADVNLTPQLIFDGKLYATQQDELWVLDGTPDGTTHFAMEGFAGETDYIVDGINFLYLVVQHKSEFGDITERTLWRSDGTPEGTDLLVSDEPFVTLREFAPTGDGLFFTTNDGLWYVSNSSQNIVQMFETPSEDHPAPRGLTVLNERLFFVADDGVHGLELWQSDGTPQGTMLFKEIGPAERDGVAPYSLLTFGDRIFFSADDGVHGQELWQSDGTVDGTMLVADINPGAGDSAPDNFVVGATHFYFDADDGSHGRELWQSQGDADTTTLLVDLYSGAASANPVAHDFFNNILYFSGTNGTDGEQLFALHVWIDPALLTHRLYLPAVSTN